MSASSASRTKVGIIKITLHFFVEPTHIFSKRETDLVDSYQMSDELLMCFIRARKYNLQRASKTVIEIITYFSFR